jgi:AcrR family transcriptional regulator
MTPAGGGAGAGKAALSRSSILDAGLALLDEGGPAALSMRSLAQELGVTATAIYYHYAGRDELLESVVDRVCSRIIDPVPAEGPWDDRLKALMGALVDQACAHPAVATWTITNYARKRPVLRIHELMLSILRGAGFDAETAMAIKGVLLRFCVGHLTLRAAADGPRWDELSDDELPEHQAAGAAIDAFDPEANFRTGIDILLAGFTP